MDNLVITCLQLMLLFLMFVFACGLSATLAIGIKTLIKEWKEI